EHLLGLGIEAIEAHDQRLVDHLLRRLAQGPYRVTSPTDPGKRRSTLIFFSHREGTKNRAVYEALRKAGVYVAFRRGSLRLSPHLYNSTGDLERALHALQDFG